MDARLGRGLGWTSFSNGVQEEGVRGDGGVGLCSSGRMAATGFHNKVERVFLVMHIGFVGAYSSNVKRGFFGTNGGLFWYIWAVYLYILGVFWFLPGGGGGVRVGTNRAVCWYISGVFMGLVFFF